jgi:ankyrin repeat protein
VTPLLQNPHDIDLRNEKGETPLLCAVQTGNEEVVDQLLEAGADPSASTTAGPEDEARRQLELEIYERTEYNRNAEEKSTKSTSNVVTTWGDMGKGSRDRYTLRRRNDTGTSSNSFSTLASTLRPQRMTSGLHYITLQVEIMKTFQLLLAAGIDASKEDSSGMTASDYDSPVQLD